MSEILGGNLDSNENIPKLKKATPEEVDKVKDEVEYSNKLIKINNVLNVLDFPDNIEDKFRKILEKQDDKTLIDLASKQKNEILSFLKNETINEKNIEDQKNESKISKLQSIFTSEILDQNPKIKEQFDSLEQSTDKEKVFREIINLLKEPGKLKSVIDSIGGIDKNNPAYIEFRDTLIGIDSSFENIFKDLENINTGESLSTDDIVDSLEKDSGGIIDLDLKSNPPLSKMSLVGSEYSFNEEIDKEALVDIIAVSKNELETISKSFGTLKDFGAGFDDLLSEIKNNWGKPNFKENLNNSIANFSNTIFNDLGEVYNDLDIKSDVQITEQDIKNLANNPNELKTNIENIKDKFLKIKSQIGDKQTEVLSNYKGEIKELLKTKAEKKEKQLEVLKFFKASGFDLLPKELTNRLINDIQSNVFIIPELNLDPNNIDLENGHFGESGAFIDKDGGINTMAKINIVKFMNKMISGSIEEPLDVETIANGVGIADVAKLKNEFLKSGIVSDIGWNISSIRKNLRKMNN